MKKNRLAVELSITNGAMVDHVYESIIILLHLHHDSRITVKNYRYIEDSEYYDSTHGYLFLEFATEYAKEMAAKILKDRGYTVAELLPVSNR